MTTGNGTVPSPGGEELSGRVGVLLREEAIWASPPAHVESSIVTAISGKQVVVTPKTPPVRRRRRLVPLLAGAGALVLGVLLWLGPGTSQPSDQDTVFALSGTDLVSALEGTATARPSEAGWYIRIDVTGLPPAPEGTYYEGWVLDGVNAVSIGTFHMRGGGDSVVLWAGVSLVDYPELWVTLQEEGGGYAPSEVVYLTGRAPDLEP